MKYGELIDRQDVSDTSVGDTIRRQAVIDEIEYELEMINSALDTMTLDFNARERLRQRKGEAREILNSIQTLPSAQPLTAYVISDEDGNIKCSNCGSFECWGNYCMNCGAKMRGKNNG